MIPPLMGSDPVAALLATYKPSPNQFDELCDGDGRFRPHWHRLMEHLRALGAQTLDRRWQQAQVLLHDNGVSYNAYGDPGGMERPWNLSPLPVVLDQKDWRTLEAGVAQRASLLDALLADLYGRASCLTEGILPPVLVFGRPSFLRPLHGHVPTLRRWLTLYAADVVRGPDGRFLVLADRTQAPSGMGYALENRLIISQVLPEAFRDCNVERLAGFFRRLQDTLSALAPHNRDNPNVVLLTPGPYNATYFEQAYLAQYLGVTLVTAADLTVREERVFLKTLGGLQQVDVIFRRVNDDYCDPLELRSETLLGVPGLVQSVRAGHVSVANAIGSGLVRTPVLLPYLPRLCRHLLGEDLLLDSAPSWWCGDPDGLAHALANMDRMVWKPSYTDEYVHSVAGNALSDSEHAALRANILAHPQNWVAQENVSVSVVPVLTKGGFEARSLVLRSFAVAGRDAYHVMPGALARVASSKAGFEVTMQMGAGSKDVWVPSDGPVNTMTLLPSASQRIALSRGGGDLPSRAADNLYWLGRYAERAEALARTARVLLHRLADADPGSAPASHLQPLVAALAAQAELSIPIDPVDMSLADVHALLIRLLSDPETPGSLASTVHATLHVARMARDRLSMDCWRTLAGLETELVDPVRVAAASPALLLDGVQRLILRLVAFAGLAGESMTRGHAWRFLDMGRRVERGVSQCTLLRHALAVSSERDGPLFEAVLEVADSSMTYRRRYLTVLQLAPLVDLLLIDESNPRSVAYQVVALEKHLRSLPAASTGGLQTREQRVVMDVLARLRLADVDALCPLLSADPRIQLLRFLDDLIAKFPALSDNLTERYLSHAAVSRNLAAGASMS